ncbi:hypothetical protein K1719_008993 [Acacia pycnantha]|nr:hypothetical protein K1719_008993 [Acacia pycnantha]
MISSSYLAFLIFILLNALFSWNLNILLKLYQVDEVQQPRQSIQNNNVNGTKDYSQQEECEWGRYFRGAVYAIQSRGNNLSQVRKYALVVYIVVHHSTSYGNVARFINHRCCK